MPTAMMKAGNSTHLQTLHECKIQLPCHPTDVLAVSLACWGIAATAEHCRTGYMYSHQNWEICIQIKNGQSLPQIEHAQAAKATILFCSSGGGPVYQSRGRSSYRKLDSPMLILSPLLNEIGCLNCRVRLLEPVVLQICTSA